MPRPGFQKEFLDLRDGRPFDPDMAKFKDPARRKTMAGLVRRLAQFDQRAATLLENALRRIDGKGAVVGCYGGSAEYMPFVTYKQLQRTTPSRLNCIPN